MTTLASSNADSDRMESIAQFFSLPIVYWSLMMVYVLTVVGIAAVILSENRNR